MVPFMVSLNARAGAILLAAWVLAAASGCGYTQKSLLSENIKSIHVAPVKNEIDLSSEINDKSHFRVYRPGLEVDITNAIINQFIFDGHLKVVSLEKANAVVEAKLVDYRRDPLRYSNNEDIQEYRLSVLVDVTVTQTADHKILWHENLVGETTFFLSGSRAVSEDEAAAKAVEDLARRVVEKTIELW